MPTSQAIIQWLIGHRWEVLAISVAFFIAVRLLSKFLNQKKSNFLRLRSRKEQEYFNALSTVYNPRPFRRTNKKKKD